jgi:ABC transporter substrate binding protein
MQRIGLAVVLAIGLSLVPLAVETQQTGKTYRVGLILTTSPVAVMAGPNPAHPSPEPSSTRCATAATCEVIVVPVNSIVQDAKRVTSAVPIIMAGSSAPVEAGLVASLARPGGNVTGLTIDTGPELEAKRLQILKEVLPHVSRVAYVGTKADWASERGLSMRAAARALAVNC